MVGKKLLPMLDVPKGKFYWANFFNMLKMNCFMLPIMAQIF
jgi:hypothetical protein